MSFKDFLRKTIVDLPIEYVQTECEQTYLDGKQDFAEALGEWAWLEGLNSIKEHIEQSKPITLKFEDFNQPNEFDDFGIDYFAIALACLGEKEVKRRLKEVR